MKTRASAKAGFETNPPSQVASAMLGPITEGEAHLWDIAGLFSATLPMMLFSPSSSKWTSCNCNSSLLSTRSATAVSQLYYTCPIDGYSTFILDPSVAATFAGHKN